MTAAGHANLLHLIALLNIPILPDAMSPVLARINTDPLLATTSRKVVASAMGRADLVTVALVAVVHADNEVIPDYGGRWSASTPRPRDHSPGVEHVERLLVVGA